MAFSDMLNKGIQFEVMGLPIGRGAYLAAGQGVAQSITSLLQSFKIPPILSSVAGAWAINNVNAVQKVLGKVGSHDLSSVMVMQGINNQFDLTEKINSMLSSVESALPEVESVLPGVGGEEETAGLEGAYSAPAVSGAEEPVGQVSGGTTDMDIYDQYMDQAQMT